MATIESILNDVSYGPTIETETLARSWINQFPKGHYINNTYKQPTNGITFETKKFFNDEVLTQIADAGLEDVDAAVEAANSGFGVWNGLSANHRAKHLYSIARNVQKHQAILACVEALDSGMPVREAQVSVIPGVIRQFYHYAGWASLVEERMKDYKPFGIVAVFVDSRLPLTQLVASVAPAIAMGNSVVVMPSPLTSLSAILLAEVCAQAGLPSGVLNILTGRKREILYLHRQVHKVVLFGQWTEWETLRSSTAGSGKSVTAELTSRCPVVVFEEADIDSAVEGVIEAAFTNSGLSNSAGSRLLIQEPIYDRFVKKLKARIGKLTVGDNMDKNNDQGGAGQPASISLLNSLIQKARDTGAEIAQSDFQPNQFNFPPTLVTRIQTSDEIFYSTQLSGPVTVAVPFRTLKEGVTIANHTIHGMCASVWTENISVALEAASLINAGTVWINCHNRVDAAAAFGGRNSSGFSRLGSQEALYEFVQPSWLNVQFSDGSDIDSSSFGASSNINVLPSAKTLESGDSLSIDKTHKLFYGGLQKRPDTGTSYPVLGANNEIICFAPNAGKKDVLNATEAAMKAFASWSKKDGHSRAQLLYYIAENVERQEQEIAQTLVAMTGQDISSALQEVRAATDRFFYWAAYCDKNGGSLQETPFYGYTVCRNEPVGVIGVVCPDEFPFLSFCSLLAPSIARGNVVLMVPSQRHPMAALHFHRILETSDIPAGVVNILSGDSDVLTRALTEHHGVNSIWYFRSIEGSKFIEKATATSFKRTWLNYGVARDFSEDHQGQGEEYLRHSTSSKTIWMPMGDIFAN